MRLVALGILATLAFGAGCALEAGDGAGPGSSPGLTTGTTRLHVVPTPRPASSTAPPLQPEPSPWLPAGPDDDSPDVQPEPSPWHAGVPSASGGDPSGTNSSGGGSTMGGGTGGTTSTPAGVHIIGHWDLRSIEQR